MNAKVLSAALGALVFGTAALPAETIFNWGGTGYVSADQSMALPSPTDTGATTRTWQYSSTIPITPASGYTGPSIYGAIEYYNESGSPVNLLQNRVKQTTSDQILFGTGATLLNQRVTGLVFFKQSDFSGSLSSGQVGFDGSSTVTIANDASSGTVQLRAAVLNNGTWYLSNTVANTYGGDVVISNAFTEMWGSWTPTGAPLSAAPSSFTTAGSSFQNIEAVGYWFNSQRTGGSTNLASSTISSVSFTGVAIPEPSSLALVGLGIAGALVGLRRRCTKA